MRTVGRRDLSAPAHQTPITGLSTDPSTTACLGRRPNGGGKGDDSISGSDNTESDRRDQPQRQTHDAAVIDTVGRPLRGRAFTASPAGYRALVARLDGQEQIDRITSEVAFAHLELA